MIDLKQIPDTKEALDRYEVENIFHSWSFQPGASPKRVVSAKGVRFTDDGGRETGRSAISWTYSKRS
ncbi:MAG: hypothetical protein JRK53_12475 [Deltaproteobacteria bacterium]|nr:hypothetical protein [Deltaproteobacteria bacterium]MBW1816205.1 hypothetical protein [Deltaproteobacteria bacterium]